MQKIHFCVSNNLMVSRTLCSALFSASNWIRVDWVYTSHDWQKEKGTGWRSDKHIYQRKYLFALSIVFLCVYVTAKGGNVFLMLLYFLVILVALNRVANLKGIQNSKELIVRASVRAVVRRHEKAKTRERNCRLDRCATDCVTYEKLQLEGWRAQKFSCNAIGN